MDEKIAYKIVDSIFSKYAYLIYTKQSSAVRGSTSISDIKSDIWVEWLARGFSLDSFSGDRSLKAFATVFAKKRVYSYTSVFIRQCKKDIKASKGLKVFKSIDRSDDFVSYDVRDNIIDCNSDPSDLYESKAREDDMDKKLSHLVSKVDVYAKTLGISLSSKNYVCRLYEFVSCINSDKSLLRKLSDDAVSEIKGWQRSVAKSNVVMGNGVLMFKTLRDAVIPYIREGVTCSTTIRNNLINAGYTVKSKGTLASLINHTKNRLMEV